jgi:hypothetical protein
MAVDSVIPLAETMQGGHTLAQVIHDPDRIWTHDEMKELIHEHVETLLDGALRSKIIEYKLGEGYATPKVTAKIVESEKTRGVSALGWTIQRPVSLTLTLTITHPDAKEET